MLFLRGIFHITGGAVYLSGIDIIHGTPVLDIKPYIADYDSPQHLIEPLGECNLQNNHYKPKIVSQSDAKTDSCAQQQLSECEEPQPCGRTKEKPTCPEHRASGENDMQHKDTAQIQQRSPKHREIAGLGVESRSGQTPSVAEEQMGSCRLEKSFSEESTDKWPRRRKEAVAPRGGRGEVQPVPPRCPPRMVDAAHHSVVPAWVRAAPVATLEVRFTPHAEMDLEHLSSEGEPGTFYFLFLNERGAFTRRLSQICYF